MQTTKASIIRTYTALGWWGTTRIDELLDLAVAAHPQRIAVVDPPNRSEIVGGEPLRWTYLELARRIELLTISFYARGVRPDDIVVVQLPNIVELPEVILALSKLGAIISPVPVQYGMLELSRINDLLDPKAYLSLRNFKGQDLASANSAAFKGKMLLTVASLNDSTDLYNCDASPSLREECSVYLTSRCSSANDIVTICWTSGTTGTPKGVPRSHNHWISIASAVRDLAGLRDNDAYLNPFPMVNMGGIGGFLVTWLESAGKLVLHHPMDLPIFLSQLAAEKITYTIAPPAVLTMLLKDPALLEDVDLSSLRAIGSGSAPLPSWMIEGWENRYGIAILNNFGSNEGMCLASGPDDVPNASERGELVPRFGVEGFSWTNGMASMVRTKLIDPETNEEITVPNRPGELLYAGPTIFDGYWKSPQANAEVFSGDYFHTGDLFEIDGPENNPCYYRFVGRLKDIISRGGMKISPAELDNLLASHPQILDAAAVGIPDEVLGEKVGVALVVAGGESLTLEDVVAYLRNSGIAKFKLPEASVIVDELPRNPLGKVLRQELLPVFAERGMP